MTPNGASVFASHATACTGSPSAAAPAPVACISPFFDTTIPTSLGVHPSIGTTSRPRTMAADEARSEIVSTSLILQSRIRLSTTSIAARAPPTASAASAAVRFGPRSERSSVSAISASARGWMKDAVGRLLPSSNTMLDSTGP